MNKKQKLSIQLILCFFFFLITTPCIIAVTETDAHYIEVELKSQGDKPWCGPACVVMVLNYWHIDVTVEEAGMQIDPEQDGAKTTELVRYLQGFEVGLYKLNSIEELKTWISRDHPIMVLVWSDTTKTAGHYLVITGFDEDGIHLNDPNGKKVEFTYEKFSDLWTRHYNYGLVISPVKVFLTDPDQTNKTWRYDLLCQKC